MAKGQRLIVAEGYMDVIALARAGFEGAVAPLGTAVTEEQLRLMWRVSPEPVIALDGDAAGQRAAQRLIDLALPHDRAGQALRFVILPAGQDPDDLIQAAGPGAMGALLDGARPLLDLLWRARPRGTASTAPNAARRSSARLADAIAKIPDERTRAHYAERTAPQAVGPFRPPQSRQGAKVRQGPAGRSQARRGGASTAPRAPHPAGCASGCPMRGEDLLEGAALLICALRPACMASCHPRLERLGTARPGSRGPAP